MRQIQCMICGCHVSSPIPKETVLRAFTCCAECLDIMPIEEKEYAAWVTQGILLRKSREESPPESQGSGGVE